MADAGRPPRLRARQRLHDRAARGVRGRESAATCRIDDPAIYPVSGGSEAIETALKLARAYHLARGETDRWIVVIAAGAATTATPSAPSTCRAGQPLRRPYEALAGSLPPRLGGVPVPRRRCPGANALGDGRRARRGAGRARSEAAGPGTVAAFVAEPIVGATLAAAVPPDGYWPAIAEVCRRHGVLLIADEVMTGFGRTGRWFAHRPLGRAAGHARRGQGRDIRLLAVRVRRGLGRDPRRRSRAPAGFVHGFTYSHHRSRRRSPARSCGSSRRRTSSRRARRRVSGSARARDRGLGRSPGRRRRSAAAACWSASSSWPTGRPGPRSRVPRSSPRPSSAPRATAASWSTRAPATRTASTATRSCSGRRSSSPTTSSTDRGGPGRGRRCRDERGRDRPDEPGAGRLSAERSSPSRAGGAPPRDR